MTVYAHGARVRRVATLRGAVARRRAVRRLAARRDRRHRAQPRSRAARSRRRLRVGVDVPGGEARAEESAELRAARQRVGARGVPRSSGSTAALERARAPRSIVEDDPSDEPPARVGRGRRRAPRARRAARRARADAARAARGRAARARRRTARARGRSRERDAQSAAPRRRRGCTSCASTSSSSSRGSRRRRHDPTRVSGRGGALGAELRRAARWRDARGSSCARSSRRTAGEDWTGVALRLSTAEPEQFTQLPELHAAEDRPPPARAGEARISRAARRRRRAVRRLRSRAFRARRDADDDDARRRAAASAPVAAELTSSPTRSGTRTRRARRTRTRRRRRRPRRRRRCSRCAAAMRGSRLGSRSRCARASSPRRSRWPRRRVARNAPGGGGGGATRERRVASGRADAAPRLRQPRAWRAATSRERGTLVAARHDASTTRARDASTTRSRSIEQLAAAARPRRRLVAHLRLRVRERRHRRRRVRWRVALDRADRRAPAPRSFATSRCRASRPTCSASRRSRIRSTGRCCRDRSTSTIAASSSSRASVDYTPPGGTVDVGLGVDPTVKIARNVEFHEEATGMLRGALRLVHAITIDVENLSPRADRARGARARPGHARGRRRRSRSRSARSSRRGRRWTPDRRRAARRTPARRLSLEARRAGRRRRSCCAPATRSRSPASTSSSAATGGSRERPTVIAPVAAVTVLEDRASVTRRGTLALRAGQQRIVIERVSPVLVDKTLDRDVHGARVLDVRCERYVAPWREATRERGTTPARCAPSARASRPRATPRSRELAAARAETEALARARRRRASRSRDPRRARGHRATDAAARARRARRAGCRRARASRRRRARRRGSRRAARSRSPRASTRAEAEAGEQAARLVIDRDRRRAPARRRSTASYVVPGAAWRPYHRAQLARDTGKLEWQTTACVWQATGEDWIDVELTCSLERPSLGVEPPDARRRRAAHAPQARHGRRRGARAGAAAHRPRRGGPLAGPGIDDGGLGLRARRAAASRVRADGTPHRIAVGSFTDDRAGLARRDPAALAVGPRPRAHHQHRHDAAARRPGRSDHGVGLRRPRRDRLRRAGREVLPRLRSRGRRPRPSHRDARARRRRPARRLERRRPCASRCGSRTSARRSARSSSPSASRSPRSSRSTSQHRRPMPTCSDDDQPGGEEITQVTARALDEQAASCRGRRAAAARPPRGHARVQDQEPARRRGRLSDVRSPRCSPTA